MRKTKVWDLAVRLFHWTLTAGVLGALLTSDNDDTVAWHVRLGLGVLGLVVFRFFWGLWGSPAARFSAFVRGPKQVWAYARAAMRGQPPLHVSHNPLGGAMVVTLLAVLLGTTVTGALVYAGPEWDGALALWLSKGAGHHLKEVHEALGELLLPLIGLHVAGVILSSVLERQNLVAGMVTGNKLAPKTWAPRQPSRIQRAAGLATAVLLGLTAARVALALFPIGEAHAANGGARAQLERYQRSAGPGFQAEPSKGEALFRAEHAVDGKVVACATCHSNDPTRPGRTPAGKNLEPLAPRANPAAFTEPKKTAKWFTRNCKQVLGRECTDAEKAHFLAWLFTL